MDQFLIPNPDEDLAAFSKRCTQALAPGIVELKPFTDQRGWSLMGLMVGVLDGGQINYSTQHTGVVKAWHRHARQIDYWCVLHGLMKVAVMDHDGPRRWSTKVSEHHPAIVVIPATLWHGVQALSANFAGLLYYVDQVYDVRNPDEDRKPRDWQWDPWDSVPR